MFDTVEHTGATAIVEPAGPGYVGKTISPNLEADVFTVTVADDIAMVWDADFTACDPGSPTTCSVGGHTWVMNAAAQVRNPGLGGLVTGYTHEGHAVVSRTGPDETVTTYSYDLVGSMVGSSDGITMGWDARNRMVTWTDGTVSWSYDYDSGGERRVASDGVTTRRYLDVLEVEVGGDSQITYTHAGQTVAVRDTTTGDLDVVVSDHLGSPQVAWNPTTAVVTGTRSHTPYGGLRTQDGAIPGTRGYTGQHADPTGLAYYGARYYSPDLMVFISADTIIPDPGSAGGLNRYGYVAGNPVNRVDPTGHCWWTPGSGDSACWGSGTIASAWDFLHRNRGLITSLVTVGVCIAAAPATAGAMAVACNLWKATSVAVNTEQIVAEQGLTPTSILVILGTIAAAGLGPDLKSFNFRNVGSIIDDLLSPVYTDDILGLITSLVPAMAVGVFGSLLVVGVRLGAEVLPGYLLSKLLLAATSPETSGGVVYVRTDQRGNVAL